MCMRLSNSNFFKPIITIFLLLLFYQANTAQTISEIAHYKEKYPNSDLVKLLNEQKVDIKIIGDNISIEQIRLNKDIFLNESANLYSKGAVSYSTFYQLEKIEASTFNLTKGKYSETKVTDFKEKDELNGFFHDDVKSVNFIYPNMSEGTISQLYTVEKINNPRFLSGFFIGGPSPVLNSKLTITADKNVDLNFKEFNTDSVHIKFSKSEKRNRIIYTWEAENTNYIKLESGTPNYRYYLPHIIPYISQYKTKENKIVKLSNDVSTLYGWYYSLIKNLNMGACDTGMVKIVESLTKDKKTEPEKVAAIYYWVQNNIKYIAFENGLGGFVPREANEIFQKKYGDCKDNSNILMEMLKIANIKSYLTWIGTRDIPYKYNELPTPFTDNHMILTYKNNGKAYFLDATGQYLPLGLPSSFIQGKEALVGKDSNEFEILKVPVIEAEINSQIDTSVIWIDNENLKGKGSRYFWGYEKTNIFNRIAPKASTEKTKEYYNSLLQKGNNKFLIDSLNEINKFEYDKNFEVDYAFSVDDYVVNANNETYINLNLDKLLLYLKIDEDRKMDIEAPYKCTYTFNNQLIIPKNYHVEYLPENINLSNDYITVSISYQQKGNKIIYAHKVKLNYLILPKSTHREMRELIKKIEKAYKETIVIKK